MKKIMLISGCSHAAGSEIDGTQDSKYNRSNSFGNLLAEKMNYTPVNIASPGSTNSCIARSILEWFNTEYNKKTMKVFVLTAWTEISRLEIPTKRDCHYNDAGKDADWISASAPFYLRINFGYDGGTPEEKKIFPKYQKFMADNLKFLEINSLNLILQLQYFFKSMNVDYLMCNTMETFEIDNHTKLYFNMIDKSCYIDPVNNDLSFYWYYKKLGYENLKANYWHHNEVPHSLYADKLYKFIKIKT